MGLATGTPQGVVTQQDEIYLEGAPYIYYQDYEADELNIPDGDGFYWGLTGSASYPIYQLACYEDVNFGSDISVNSIRCDNIGDKDVIQKLNHLEVSLTLSSLFPLSVLRHILRAGEVTLTDEVEKMGIGTINNNQYYHVYMPKVYDDVALDWVGITIHRAKFVDAWTIQMPSGDKWTVTGITIWGMADESMPADQQFATVIRRDPSAL